MLLGYILFIFPMAALLSALIYLPLARLRRRRGVRLPWLAHLVRYALVGYVVSLLYITIFWFFPLNSFPPEYYFYNLKPFAWLTDGYLMGPAKMLEQLILNVLMFLPLGLLLPLAGRRFRRFRVTAAAVLAMTAAIEVVQFFIGRSADIDDVIMNFAGGALGFALFCLLDRLLGKFPFWQRLLADNTSENQTPAA